MGEKEKAFLAAVCRATKGAINVPAGTVREVSRAAHLSQMTGDQVSRNLQAMPYIAVDPQRGTVTLTERGLLWANQNRATWEVSDAG